MLPGAAYLEMALAAARQATGQPQWKAVDVEFREPCFFDEPRLLETVISAEDAANGRRQFEIASTVLQVQEGQPGKSAPGRFTLSGFWSRLPLPRMLVFPWISSAIQSRAKSVLDKDAFYDAIPGGRPRFWPGSSGSPSSLGQQRRGLGRD